MSYKDAAKEVTVEISNFCPLNCIHCSTWYSYSRLEECVINIDDIINKTIEHIKSTPNTSVRVRFSGGEPLPFLDKSIF